MGYWQYPPIVEQYHVPVVVTGFEPLDIMEGDCGARSSNSRRAKRTSTMRTSGSCRSTATARRKKLLSEVFEVCAPSMARHRRFIPPERIPDESGVSVNSTLRHRFQVTNISARSNRRFAAAANASCEAP